MLEADYNSPSTRRRFINAVFLSDNSNQLYRRLARMKSFRSKESVPPDDINMWLVLICGIVAASPDIVGWYNYAAYEKGGKFAKGILKLFHVQFHRGIQKFERPWGIYVEGLIFVILLSMLLVS